MRIHMAETRRDGVRVVLTFVVVAAVAVGTVALLELRPFANRMVDTMKAVETTVPEASGADGVPFAELEERDRLTVLRPRQVGKDIPRHWRRRLVRQTAPALAQWIGGMGEAARPSASLLSLGVGTVRNQVSRKLAPDRTRGNANIGPPRPGLDRDLRSWRGGIPRRVERRHLKYEAQIRHMQMRRGHRVDAPPARLPTDCGASPTTDAIANLVPRSATPVVCPRNASRPGLRATTRCQ